MNNCFLKSYECLMSIYVDKAFSTIQLNKVLNNSKPTDRPLITKIVYGVLDHNIELEYIISQFTKKTKVNTRIMLSIGVFCLKYLSMPTYAVVNDTAELAKVTEDIRIVGFVNATLKNIANALQSDSITYPDKQLERMSVMYSYPLWAIRKLVKDYSLQEATNIVSHSLPVANTIRVNLDKISNEQFVKMLADNNISYRTTMLEDCYAIVGRINIDASLYTNMSLSSMMIARSLDTKGECSVIDCCSAPGGKSVYIKQLNQGASITACELHPHRVELINNYAERMGVDIKTVCCDSTVYNSDWDSKFDYCLCDVPCSGYGVVDNRPDIKIFREQVDISNLMKVQRAILDNCSKYVKVGGTLIYSTCTIFSNENKDIINKFLSSNTDWQLSPLTLPYYKGASMYQFLPHIDNTQGFFVARLIRIR